MPTSNKWVHRTRRLCRGLRLLTATVAAAGATMATVAAAWATTLVTATAAARLTAVTAAAAWLAAVAATVVAAVTTAAFLGSLSSSSPRRLTAVCLLHYGCNCQDTWVIVHLRYSCVS